MKRNKTHFSAGVRGDQMALTCEICGSPIRGAPIHVNIDGAALQICQNCAGRRAPQKPTPPEPIQLKPRPVVHNAFPEPDLEIDPDYNSIVKRAREGMGLTQEALGRAINVKPSVISHIESKKLKPDPILASKLMHYLHVNIMVSSSELDSTGF